ncbi:helix-turn-helix domain-containing protein [Frankia sp. CiP3]|uniref:helix-turn-helix domain-containing protein n=1 Tax=Frankia sp. CiP3 TaxID=2880971 RepID=UPI001EF531BF|nr:helix-turn-helix transcriptional regulator [Frankia sp. CiP3]
METFGQALRRLRGDLSVRELARRANCGKSYVSDLEHGRRNPSPGVAAALDTALGASGELIARGSPPVVLPGLDGPAITENLVDVDRRDFIAATAAALTAEPTALRHDAPALTATGLPMIKMPAWSADTRRGPTVDRGLLTTYAEVGEALAGLYRSADPRVVLPMAVVHADNLLDLYGRTPSAELAHLLVGVHAQVGLWACHADIPAQAYRYLATACEVAAGTNDPPLHARALGALSYLYSSAPRGGEGGNPGRALRLLDDALAMATHADPFTRGWLLTWRADQHATLGHPRTAAENIDRARAALDAGEDSDLTGFFSRRNYGYGMRGHLDSVQALVHGLTGHTNEADRIFSLVQQQAANGRRRAATYAHQAVSYAQATTRDPEAACAALSQSIDLARSGRYTMGLRRSSGVRAGFDPAWSHLTCVREVDEHLQLATAG